MNKPELIKRIAENTGQSQEVINEVLIGFVKVAVPAVRDEGEQVVLPGMGTFKLKETAAHKGINPSTKEKIDIAASRTIGFKPSANVKKVVE